MSKIEDNNYFQVSGFMVNKLGLKGISLMVYAIIYGFSQDGESYFNGSRQYLCDFTNSTKPTIDKALDELVSKKYIIKKAEILNNITFNRYKVNLNVVNFTTSKETLPPSKETLSGGGKETLPNNNNLDNKEYNNNLKEIQKKTDAELIYDYYLQKKIRNHRELTPKMISAIKKSIKENDLTLQQVFQAIDRYSQVVNDTRYFFDTRWTIEEFFSRRKGIVDFLDEGSKWVNYQSWLNKSKPRNNVGGISATPEEQEEYRKHITILGENGAIQNPYANEQKDYVGDATVVNVEELFASVIDGDK